MDASILLIIDLPLFTFAVLLYELIAMPSNGVSRKQRVYLRMCFGATLCLCVTEMIYEFVLWEYIDVNFDQLYAIDTVYNFFLMEVAVVWCLTGFQFMKKTPLALRGILHILLLSGVLFCICQIGFKGGEAFIYVADGELIYGTATSLWTYPCFIPLIITMCWSIYNYFKKSEYANRDRVLPFVFFSIVHMAAGLLQTYFQSSYFLIEGLCVASLFLFISLTASLVIIDKDSGLPNRRQFIIDADRLIQDKSEWIITVFDMVGYDSICKEFGRLEKNIIFGIFKQVLSNAAEEHDGKVYLIDKDRFAFTFEGSEEGLAQEVCNECEKRIGELAVEKKTPYVIRVASAAECIGQNNTLTIPDIFKSLKSKIIENKKNIEKNSDNT